MDRKRSFKYSKWYFYHGLLFCSIVANSKNVEPDMVKDIDFVAYEVIEPILKPSKQIKYLLDNKYNTVPIMKGKNKPFFLILRYFLITYGWRLKSAHEIDGIIVYNHYF